MLNHVSLLIVTLSLGLASFAEAHNQDPEADLFTTCATSKPSALLPNLDLYSRLAEPTVADTQERYVFKLPDGSEILLENVQVSDEEDADVEAANSPVLASALNALPEDQYDDGDAFQVAGKFRGKAKKKHGARYTNRGILGPSGRWPVSSGGCATLSGQASFYGGGEKLKKHTASGKVFNSGTIAAAHRTLPLGTRVEVVNLTNGKTLNNVVINDRGPAIETGRLIDLTKGAASKLGFINAGHTNVKVRVCRGGSGKRTVGWNN